MTRDEAIDKAKQIADLLTDASPVDYQSVMRIAQSLHGVSKDGKPVVAAA